MKAHVDIGAAEGFTLSGAVAVYRGRNRAYCAWHEAVETERDQRPALGPAQPLSTEFVRCLAAELTGRVAVEILHPNVLVRTEALLVWWTPPARRTMFFRHTDSTIAALSGKQYPQPPLVWAVSGRLLRVRAMTEGERPVAATKLFIAPYYNTDGSTAEVCQGSMRSPEHEGAAAIQDWERAFFQSEFSHQIGARKLTSHPRGFAGLWKSLAAKEHFPTDYLMPANETLADFIGREP